ncbi:MAG: branched-chain amino acid ABC transporter substrate-binding protein [Wenzhouxiangella sp.]|nr:MAG: branched-chain amino acid ABC transporter substrate-binding protein [Wenzhouxiangella sp.]
MMKVARVLLMFALVSGLTACGDSGDDASTVRGVTDSEIRFGGAHDLSGVFAAVSNPALNGANLRIAEVNEAGGVHGRRIRYIVEDHGYQVPRAAQAANKLVTRDEVFGKLLTLGTPHNLAAFPIMDRHDVPSLFPLTPARPMLETGDFSRRFSLSASYYDNVGNAIDWLFEREGFERICVMYIPSDFGEEIHQAARDAAERHDGLSLVSATSHRPDESNFSGTLSRKRAGNCDLLVLGLAVRATVAVASSVRDMNWDGVELLASTAAFHAAVSSAPGGATEGMWAASAGPDIQTLRDRPESAAFIEAYRQAYGSNPDAMAQTGYSVAHALVLALEKAGRDLTVDTLVAALESLDYIDPVSGIHVRMGPDDHILLGDTWITRVRGGIWETEAVIEMR